MISKLFKMTSISCALTLALALAVSLSASPGSSFGLKKAESVVRVGLSRAEEKVSIDSGNSVMVLKIDKDGDETLWFKVNNIRKLTLEPSTCHIQIGGTYKSRKDIYKHLTDVSKTVGNAFIGYDGGWKVYWGSFDSPEQARSAMAGLKGRVGGMGLSVDDHEDGAVDIRDSIGIIFSYNTKKTNVVYRRSDGKPIGYYGGGLTHYRGSIGVEYISRSGLYAINYVKVEDYLRSVVTMEMSKSWPLESLKAQAIAARTYALSHIGKHGSKGYDVCDTVDCQVYGGVEAEAGKSEYGNRANLAVSQTAGMVATHSGKLIGAFYHSNSGGRTESSENVWFSPTAYLKGKRDPYSMEKNAKSRYWEYEITFGALERQLASSGISVGSLTGVHAARRSPSGRVTELVVSGTSGSATLRKETIQSVLGYGNIRSTSFNLSSSGMYSSLGEGMAFMGFDRKLRFSGTGYGHGVGMSQWGAYAMAKNHGLKFDTILKFYYTNISLNRVEYE